MTNCPSSTIIHLDESIRIVHITGMATERIIKNVRTGAVTIHVPIDELAQIDQIVAERSRDGVTAYRQGIVLAWIRRGLAEAARGKARHGKGEVAT